MKNGIERVFTPQQLTDQRFSLPNPRRSPPLRCQCIPCRLLAMPHVDEEGEFNGM